MLTTERLILRPITIDDTADLAEVYADADVTRFIGASDADRTRTQVERFVAEWADRGVGILAVIERATGRFLGRSGLHYWPQFDETEAGWVLRRDAWGSGFATEAGTASIRWGICDLGLPLVTSIIDRGNARSIAVAERLGMTILRDDHIYGHDCHVYGTTSVS